MERNVDLRRGGMSSLQRRRALLRDSREEEGSRQVELQEMGRLRDREALPRKDRDREFSKRRKVDNRQHHRNGTYRDHDTSDSSDDDEEYDEDVDHHHPRKIHQSQNRMNPPPVVASSARSNNHRRSLRTLRSSPAIIADVDELIGVPVPRRARSSTFRRGHESWSNGSGGLGDELNRRRYSASPAAAAGGGSSPSSSGGGSSMRRKRKSVEPRNRTLNGGASTSQPPTSIQDDIEFEVAEALFDLMKQSQSSKNVDKDGTSPADDDEARRLNGDDDIRPDENGGFSVQNEESNEENGDKDKEMGADDEQVGDELLVNKEKAVSPKDNEAPSSSCGGKVNGACEIQEPAAVTKTVDGTAEKDGKLDTTVLDLTASLTLSSTLENHVLESSPKDVDEERDTVRKEVSPASVLAQGENNRATASSSCQVVIYDGEQNGTASSTNHQLVIYDAENYARDASTSSRSRQQRKNLSQYSLLPSPESMNGWPGVLAPPGYVTSPQAVMPTEGGSTRSSAAVVQSPEFKFSQPRKRCATHQYLARNIRAHQQFVKTSSLSAQTGAIGHLYGGPKEATNSVAIKKDKSSDVANASTSNRLVPQQVLDQASAQKFLQGPALIFPFGHNQMAAVTASGNTSGQHPSVAAVGDASVPSNAAQNFCLPAMSYNHQTMHTNEAAAYLAMLQKNGLRYPPIPPNLLKNAHQVPGMPQFNSSIYSSPVFNIPPNQQHLSFPQNTSISNGSSSRKAPHGQKQTGVNINGGKSSADVGRNPPTPQQKGSTNRVDFTQQALAMSFGANPSVSSAHNLHMLPDMSQNAYQKNFQVSDGKSTAGPGNLQDLTKGILGKPESNGAQSLIFNKSGCGDVSATMGASMFDGLPRNMNMLPSALSGKQVPPSSSSLVAIPNFHQHQHHQQLIQLQKQHMQQMQLNGGKDGLPGSFLSSNFPGTSSIYGRAEASSVTHQWDNMPRTTAPDGSAQPATPILMSFPQQMRGSQGQTHISFGNMQGSSGSIQGQHIGSSTNSPTPKNAAGSQRNPSGPSQQAEVSQQNGSSQKSSPACRRNVPSILNTCTSQPSELKY